MSRKPTDTVQVSLRMKESLRRRLAESARKNQVSLNSEITSRLHHSIIFAEDLSVPFVKNVTVRYNPNASP